MTYQTVIASANDISEFIEQHQNELCPIALLDPSITNKELFVNFEGYRKCNNCTNCGQL